MTDIVCPQCGHRALGAATRCPRCGQEFPTELIQRPELPPARPWLRPALVAAGGAAVVVALVMLSKDRGAPRDASPAAATSSALDSDTAAAAPAPVPTTPAPIVPPATSPRAAPPGATESPSAGTGARRYATTWVNVRLARGIQAPEVGVLNPGESVLVDSLIRGWYRVVANGRTLGYAHRRFLAAAPPATTPP